jgi:hypothetical protein
MIIGLAMTAQLHAKTMPAKYIMYKQSIAYSFPACVRQKDPPVGQNVPN